MQRTPEERTQLVVLLFIVALYLGHYLVFVWPQPYYIEDSAISFAYARNLVEGEGLVPYPGGERVEGYSNALWTFLLAGWYVLGVSPWWSAKVMGAGFGAVTLFLSWAIARRARPDAPALGALAAPLLLACSSQFTIWNASGLENSLFNVLLATGVWSLTREIQDNRREPWSALAFFGLTMTRPDGIMYAALGLFARMLGTLARRQWVALALWIGAFALPYAAYNAWRYDYFAWWFPNTYYAKERDFRPFNWTGGGWKQIRDYATQYGVVYAAPLAVIAMTGLSTWRRWIGALVLAFFALFLLWDGRAGIPTTMANDVTRAVGRNWTDARVWFLLGGSVTLGLVTFGRKGWEARGMLWAALCGGVFFVVATGADWMKGYRWFSLTSVPLFTLLGVGIGALAERLPFAARLVAGWLPVRTLWATPMVIALAAPNVNGSWNFANNPETAPRDVHKRVNYMTWVQRRLGLEQVTLLDVDMGAHMWWSGWDIADIAGLIDVPFAHHRKYNKAFVTEYVFEERKPDFAHVHGSWARTSKIHLNERWEEDYVEIPGYPSGRRTLHVGNHVRKEHLAGRRYDGPANRRVDFADGITLLGWELPSPEVAPGGKLYVSTWWSATPRDSGFRVLAFLVGDSGVAHVAEVAPGYDWYAPERWQAGEVVYGRWSIPLPEKLDKGAYTLGFVVMDEVSGAVLAALPAGGTAVADAPADATVPSDTPVEAAAAAPAAEAAVGRFMRGEALLDAAVKVVSFEDAVAAAEVDRDEALRRAESGDCEGAADAFRNARRHIARNDKWFLSNVDTVTTARVRCLVARAAPIGDPVARAAVLAQARRLDHHDDALQAAADPLADELVAMGEAARASEDWETAYRAFSAALSVDATRSWARRYAEEARDKRLGIDPDKADPPVSTKKAPAKTPKKPPQKKVGAKDEPKAPPRPAAAVPSDEEQLEDAPSEAGLEAGGPGEAPSED